MELPQLNRAGLESPFARQLEQGYSQLRFAPLLEKEFREFYGAQNMARGRLSALIALVLLLSIISIDYLFGSGPFGGPINTVRLVVMCPLLAIVVVATHIRALDAHYQTIMAVAVVIAGLATIYMSHIAALDGTSYLLAGALLVVLYACLFLGFLFYVAVSVAGFLVLSHLAIGFYVGLPFNALLYMTAILAAATVIGAVSTYNLELALRTNFLETRLLNELAQRDGLTGLYNRRIFDDYIRRIWRQSRRDKLSVEIIFVDIDYFKIYNDLYGHQAGDDCLKKVGKTIARAAKRPFDFSARYGGEEFVLVLYGPPQDYARSLPEQLRHDIMDLAIEHEGSNVANYVTVSIGVAIADSSSGRSLTGAIQAADEALYEAKQAGRNRVIFKDASASEVETGKFRAAYRQAN